MSIEKRANPVLSDSAFFWHQANDLELPERWS
jgi:hypothetical protein